MSRTPVVLNISMHCSSAEAGYGKRTDSEPVRHEHGIFEGRSPAGMRRVRTYFGISAILYAIEVSTAGGTESSARIVTFLGHMEKLIMKLDLTDLVQHQHLKIQDE